MIMLYLLNLFLTVILKISMSNFLLMNFGYFNFISVNELICLAVVLSFIVYFPSRSTTMAPKYWMVQQQWHSKRRTVVPPDG